MLQRSHDRKVTSLVNKGGTSSLVKNTLGLPSGRLYSCRGETTTCSQVCYAGKLEKVYPSLRKLLLHNWEQLKNADGDTMYLLLQEMISSFRRDSLKKKAPLVFRIHWDGDFFSDEYTLAWARVIRNNPDIQFWVYTRV